MHCSLLCVVTNGGMTNRRPRKSPSLDAEFWASYKLALQVNLTLLAVLDRIAYVANVTPPGQ
jgi:hypothetical protein